MVIKRALFTSNYIWRVCACLNSLSTKFRSYLLNMVYNIIFAGKLNLGDGKDLASLKCLQRLITISQLKHSILQFS